MVEDSITVAIRPEPEAMGKVADSIEVGTPQPETRAAKRKREMPRRAASPKEESSDDTVMVGESSPLLQPSSSSKKQQRKKQDQEQHEQPPPKENKSAGTTKPTRHSARTTARRASISRDGVDAGLMARDTGASEVASVAATPLKKTPLVKAKGAESARTNGTTSNKKSRLSKRWDTEFVLEDPKSPLVKASIRVSLLCLHFSSCTNQASKWKHSSVHPHPPTGLVCPHARGTSQHPGQIPGPEGHSEAVAVGCTTTFITSTTVTIIAPQQCRGGVKQG